MDIGFVDDPSAGVDSKCHWSQILIPGELKNNPSADRASKAWLDLGRYAREVLAAQDSRRFVLGFLWLNEEQLGFDPTIITAGDKRYIEIERHNHIKRLVIDKVVKQVPCVVGRATTCWKAYREGDDSQRPLIVKDSWQFLEREEEGELLREATDKGVVDVARYYHHETVCVGGRDDDIRGNVRRGLDIMKATNQKLENSMPPPNAAGRRISRKGRSSH